MKNKSKRVNKSNLIIGIFLIVGGLLFSKPSIENFNIFTGISPLPILVTIALVLIGLFELFLFLTREELK